MTKARSLSDFIESDGSVTLVDNQEIKFGTGNDANIRHDGSNTKFTHTGTGGLYLGADTFALQNGTHDENFILMADNGAVTLYYDNSAKLATTATGVTVTGNSDVSGELYVGNNNSIFAENVVRFKSSGTAYIDHNTVDADIVFRTSDASALDTTALTLDGSDGGTAIFGGWQKMADNNRIVFGGGSDAAIFSDGTNGYMRGFAALQNNAGDHDYISFVDGGATSLYHDNAVKLATIATGINVTGKIGVGGSPDYAVHAQGTGHQRIKVEKTDAGGDSDISIAGPNDSQGWILFTDNTSGNNQGAIKYIHSNDGMYFRTNGVDNRVVIHGNGKVGFSANNTGDATTVPRDFAFYTEGGTNGVEIRSNDERLVMLGAGGSGGAAVDNGYVAIAAGNSTTKIALNAAGDSYFTGGDLGIGTTTIDAPIHTDVGAPSSSDKKLAIFQSESGRQAGFGWDDSASTLCVGSMTNHDLCLKTHFNSGGGTTRARFRVTTNTSYTPDGIFGGSATPHTIGTTGSGELLLGYNDNGSGLYSASMALAYDAIDGLSNTSYVNGFLMRDTGNNTTHLIIETDGDVKNTNNSYGSLSDERIKSDIKDANSQWDDIKALKIRNYKLATQPAPYNDQFQIGVIAQELEAAGMSGLIKESDPDTKHLEYDPSLVGEKVKSVKYSVLYMKAIKALQEAMERIEVLETKVSDLEG